MIRRLHVLLVKPEDVIPHLAMQELLTGGPAFSSRTRSGMGKVP